MHTKQAHVRFLQLKWGVELDVLGTFYGSNLENCSYIHPLENRECLVVVGGDYITMESRIGIVHTTLGHGQENFLTGMKYKLLVLSLIDDNDKFTKKLLSLLVWMSWVMEMWQFPRS